MATLLSRRTFVAAASGAAVFACGVLRTHAQATAGAVTFYFVADVHACQMQSGLSPKCQAEGKTDQALVRNVTALNALPAAIWPAQIAGAPTGLPSAGMAIGEPRGIVMGGDLTDDGGGQTITPAEGTQLLQFSRHYQAGLGVGRVHFPVYAGLGNHDLDQDGKPPDVDWYRQEMRDYVEITHEPGVFFKPRVPVENFDHDSDCYSWDWGRLHLVQLNRFGGDTRKNAVSALPWLKQDLKLRAGDGRPVIIFQHYGWDSFSTEAWDPAQHTFDDEGSGAPHWWSPAERLALIDALGDANVIAIFHGHQHVTPMIYKEGRIDVIKPKAAFLGGFAVCKVTATTFEVVLGEATDDNGSVAFTTAFNKPLG